LAHSGRWLVDPIGRVVLLRGGNVVQLVGDAHLLGAGGGRERWHADTPRLLAAAGFTAVRLVVFMERLAPAPDRIDTDYLEAIAATVAAYAEHGVATLIDLHQDEYGPEVGVRGMPAWMTLSDGHQRDRSLPFPNGYFRDRAVQVAFDGFWANRPTATGVGVQDAYVAAAATLAERFAGEPAVFGIDLMNEPATGTPCSQPDPKTADCPQLERELLAPFYAKAGRAVAAAAPRTILFVEPFMLQGALGIPIETPMPGIALQGLSYHNYGPFRLTREAVNGAAVARATAARAAILNTEWGFSHDAADLASQAQDLDGHLMPWLAWARGPFEALVNPAAASAPAVNRELVLRAYARPYPTRTAGTPLAVRFDADAGVLELRWSTRGPDGADRSHLDTEIRMPPPSFPHGYRAEAEGGLIVSAPSSATLVVRAARDASEVSLRAERIGDLPPLAAPAAESAANARLSLDSLVGDLLRDPRAKAILDEHLPTLTSSSQIGLASQAPLRAMQPYLPEMTDAVARRIEAELAALPPP
jgi:endoglycosylceramidase